MAQEFSKLFNEIVDDALKSINLFSEKEKLNAFKKRMLSGVTNGQFEFLLSQFSY